jgi:Conserved TM helix
MADTFFGMTDMINNFLESISPSMGQAPLPSLPVLLMQTATASPVSIESLTAPVISKLPTIAGAIFSLLVGWLVAMIASWLVGTVLSKTDIDNKILQKVTGSNTLGGWSAEKLAATVTFWIIFLFGVIAFLNALSLTAASAPLQQMLTQILGFLPRLLVAGLLATVAWLIATFVKSLILKTSQSFGIDRKLQVGEGGSNAMLPSKTIADLSFWAILFFFLLPVLDTLGLGSSLAPVQNLSADVLSAVPKIIKAVIIGAVSWFVAKIVRDIVTNIAAAAGSERLASRLGLTRSMPNQTLAGIAGTLVFVTILVPGVISALQALDIEAISGPAILMLNQITLMLPRVLTAGALIALSYFIGRFLSELVTTTLATLGFDNIIQVLGLSNLVNEAAPQRTASQLTDSVEGVTNTKTPSELAGILVLVTTMLTAAISATNILGIPSLTGITESVLFIGSQIMIGLVVFGVGLFLANLAFRLINASGTRQANILAQTARIVIIVLVGAMGLERMGIAPDILHLAFGLTLGALSIAAAIAFGLGGRDVAGEQLRQWLTSFKSDRRP